MTGVIIVITASGNLGQVYAGRCIMGLGIGQAGVVAPTYLAEIAPAHARGMLVSMFAMSEYVGIMIGVSGSECIVDVANLFSIFLLLGLRCISRMIVPNSGSFHRVYKSLLQAFCSCRHFCAKRVLDICARSEIGIKRRKHWEVYGAYLHYTLIS
jgi:MFS family permease